MQDRISSADDPGYFVTRGEQETERLLTLHSCYQRLHTRYLGNQGVELVSKMGCEQILDVACGLGGWAIDAARCSLGTTVIGIDLSPSLLSSAAAQAEQWGLDNVHFQVMDATQLAFSDRSFTLIHGRALQYFMGVKRWPTFLGECQRILLPAGILCLTESENIITNTRIFERLSSLHIEASRRAGYSFASTGSFTAVTAVLAQLLKKAGFVQVESRVSALDCSAGTQVYADVVQYFRLLLPLVLPFLCSWGVIQQEKGELLIRQALEELEANTFCGIWYFRTVWGQKPL
jgi:ubiquinone/menaquinone biosynthesis C-methylase UbiE